MKNIALLKILLVLALVSPAFAADGELLSREPVPFDMDGLLEGLKGERRQRLQSMLEHADQTIELSRITYESDGLAVRGYLVVPKAVKDGEKLPCVIYNRGGNREFGALDDLRAALMLGSLAERGYVVVAGQYRGNGGGEGREEFGGADVRDVLNLIPLLEGLEHADASRIGMFGWSRGGMMTYQALARTDRIRAAVIGAGVADSFEWVADRPEMETGVFAELVPDWADKREEALEERSAVRWPEKITGGRTTAELISFVDFAPTILEAAGIAQPENMTGRSFLDLLTEKKEKGFREWVMTGRERHTHARPDNLAYPSRAIRTAEYLYILNLKPDRWPAGTPDHAKAFLPDFWLADCDNGPTKTYMVENRDRDHHHRLLYELSFGKRPAEELYDCRNDPGQLVNLADDPAYADIRESMSELLMEQLELTADPRVIGGGDKFDEYPYLGGGPMHPDSGK